MESYFEGYNLPCGDHFIFNDSVMTATPEPAKAAKSPFVSFQLISRRPFLVAMSYRMASILPDISLTMSIADLFLM
jgi:hypothetical protein